MVCHSKGCFRKERVREALLGEVVVEIGRDGDIKKAFTKSGKVSYSTRSHTKEETRYIHSTAFNSSSAHVMLCLELKL
jgi:hypothetical protein